MAGEKVGEIYYTVDADTAPLVNSTGTLDDALNKTQKEFKKTDATAKATDNKLRETAKAAKEAAGGFDKARDSMSGLTKVVGAYLTLRTVQAIAELSDAYGQNASRIKNATSSAEEYERVQARLLETANGTYRALSEAQEVYLATSDVLKRLGYDTEEVLDITDSLSYAFVRDAARADQATSAMDAYSKALQKGKLDADAWQSVMVTTPSIVDGIAQATGRSALEIQKLGAEGKLSVEALNQGLLQSLDANKAAADAMAVSTKDATTQVMNALTVFVGKVNEASGASNVFVDAAKELSDALQDPQMIKAATDLAAGIVTALTAIMNAAKATVSVVRWMAEETAAAMNGAAPDDVVRLGTEVERLQRALKVNQRDPEKNAKTIAYLEKEIAQRKELIALAQKPQAPAPAPTATTSPVARPKVNAEATSTKGTSGKSEADKAAESAQKYIAALREQAEAVRNASAQERVASDVINGKVKLQQDQIRTALELAKAVDMRSNTDIIAELSKELLMSSMNAKDLAETQAVLALNQYATPEQVELVRSLSNQLYDAEQRAAKIREMGADVGKWITGEVNPITGGGFDDQQARYDQEAEKEQERYAAQLERLTAALELEKLTREEYLLQFEAMQVAHNERMDAIDAARTSVMRKQYGDAFGAVADILKNAQGEQSSAYKAMFALSKSFAIADATVNAYNAISKAWASAPFPANLAAVAATAPQVMGVVSAISSASFGGGRMYGGGVASDKMYRVNEGGAPEIFNAANGQQYLMPNTRGEVVSNADATGSGGAGGRANIVVNLIESKQGAGSVQQEQGPNGEDIVNIIVADIMGDGQTAMAIQGKFGLSPQGV